MGLISPFTRSTTLNSFTATILLGLKGFTSVSDRGYDRRLNGTLFRPSVIERFSAMKRSLITLQTSVNTFSA